MKFRSQVSTTKVYIFSDYTLRSPLGLENKNILCNKLDIFRHTEKAIVEQRAFTVKQRNGCWFDSDSVHP